MSIARRRHLDAFVAKFDPNVGYIWSSVFGEAHSWVIPLAVALDTLDDSVVALGCLKGSVDFGGGVVTATTMSGDCGDIWVTKLDGAGDYVYTQLFAGTDDPEPLSLDVDAAGNAVLAVKAGGTVDFGGGPLTAVGDRDLLVAKLDPAGNHVWSTRFGQPNTWVTDSALRVDGNNDVVRSGETLDGTIDFGSGPLPTDADGNASFVVKLAGADGAVQWATGGGEAWQGLSLWLGALAVDAAGNIYAGTMKLDEHGNELWRRNRCLRARAVAVAGSELVYTGGLTTPVMIDGELLETAGGQGDVDVFVAKLTQ